MRHPIPRLGFANSTVPTYLVDKGWGSLSNACYFPWAGYDMLWPALFKREDWGPSG